MGEGDQGRRHQDQRVRNSFRSLFVIRAPLRPSKILQAGRSATMRKLLGICEKLLTRSCSDLRKIAVQKKAAQTIVQCIAHSIRHVRHEYNAEVESTS